MTVEKPFWEVKSLDQMDREEWESLCDGCAKCCLHKLEDADSGEVFFTRVVCRYHEEDSCRCSVYSERSALVPDCITLEPGNLEHLNWMPNTCAYKLLYHGKPLPLWHPLISGSRQAMIKADQTVTGKVISEDYVHEEGYEEHLIDWASQD